MCGAFDGANLAIATAYNPSSPHSQLPIHFQNSFRFDRPSSGYHFLGGHLSGFLIRLGIDPDFVANLEVFEVAGFAVVDELGLAVELELLTVAKGCLVNNQAFLVDLLDNAIDVVLEDARGGRGVTKARFPWLGRLRLRAVVRR